MFRIWLSSLVVLFASLAPSVAITNEVFISSDHSNLFCKTMGKGNPLIVIHGGPGLTQDYLLPYLDKLAENNFVIFYDQRGCGLSIGEISTSTINMTSFINDLENIRKAFHFEKISILGHSWGGFVAASYTIAHPESIDKLILSNSMPLSSEDLTLFINEWTKRMTPYYQEIASIHGSKEFLQGDSQTMARLYRTIFRTYCYMPEKAELLNLYMTQTASLNGAKVYDIIRENILDKPYDLHRALKQVNIHALIIHWDIDVIPMSTAEHTHESIPGSQYIVLKNCGHFPYIEQPDEYFHHLYDFLK
ncbi:MAG: alpha/beta fold hydrolase [Chlamydiales bacterium]|nr:alpha/beta fold hydrolase [Chlamydiales bacterium]